MDTFLCVCDVKLCLSSTYIQKNWRLGSAFEARSRGHHHPTPVLSLSLSLSPPVYSISMGSVFGSTAKSKEEIETAVSKVKEIVDSNPVVVFRFFLLLLLLLKLFLSSSWPLSYWITVWNLAKLWDSLVPIVWRCPARDVLGTPFFQNVLLNCGLQIRVFDLRRIYRSVWLICVK